MWRFLPRLAGTLTAVTALLVSAHAPASTPAEPGWKLDRVVVVMRHGIRPPTKAQPLPVGMAPAPWPTWDVDWGKLSHHGERAVALLGAFDRASYAALIGSGCPAMRAVADTDQRTVRTAEVYVAALLPGCGVRVQHETAGVADPRFSPSAVAQRLPDSTMLAAAEATLPRGGTAQLDRDLADDWTAIDRILACHASACIAARATSLSAADGKVKLNGALEQGGSFSETLALEYADDQPPAQVGWGRATREEITHLLELHAQEFAVTSRPPSIARAGAASLLSEIAHALSAQDAPALSLFVGHDTNLALIGGALGLHWQAAQFASDDPPPGGALIFERWRNAAGRYRLEVRFRSQSLDEMRNLTPPGPGAVQSLAFAKCGGTAGCDAAALHDALSR